MKVVKVDLIDGKISNADDIPILTNGLNSSGYIIIDDDMKLYIPNDYIDRQQILDKIDELADLVDSVNLAIPTMIADPTVIAQIPILKQSIADIKANLK